MMLLFYYKLVYRKEIIFTLLVLILLMVINVGVGGGEVGTRQNDVEKGWRRVFRPELENDARNTRELISK